VLDIAYADRGNTPQARAALAPAVEKLRQGLSIATAPEGTPARRRGSAASRRTPAHMALQARVPIVPIVIRNAGDVMWKRSPLIRKGTNRRHGARPGPDQRLERRGSR